MGRIRGGALRIIHCRSDCGDADPLLCDELKSTSLNPSLSTFIPETVGSRPKTRMWHSACFPQRHHFAPLVSSLLSTAQEFPLAAGQCLQSSLVYNHQRGLSGRGCCGTVLLICVTSGNTKLSYWNLPLVFCALRFYFYKTNLVICPLFSKWKRRKFWVTPLALSMNPPVGLIFTLVVVFCSSR